MKRQRWAWKTIVAAALAMICWARGVPAAVYPSVVGLDYQTSGRERGPGIGDWYTTLTSASSDRLHRMSIEVTPAQLAAAGGSLTLTIRDAESHVPDPVGGPGDEVFNTDDPTRFTLRDRSGTVVLQSRSVASGSPGGTTVQFAIAAAGVYQVTSESGAFPISGNANVNLNDDDNGWRIDVPGSAGATGGLVGLLQGSVTHNNAGTITYSTYVIIGPGTSSVAFRNFDLDTCAGCNVTYTRPNGSSVAGTASGNGVWNNGGNLNTGQDDISGLATVGAGTNDAGVWTVTIANLTPTNQIIVEARSGASNALIPTYDQAPLRAGNFTVSATDTLSTPPATAVDHPVTLTNVFTTSDIINLTLGGTSPNWTAQLLTNGGTPLADTDGDGNVDSGVLAPGVTLSLLLRVTPGVGAVGPSITRISGVSYMDTKVVPASNVTLFIDRVTRLKPTIAKSFSPGTLAPGAVSTLTFTLTNPNSAPTLTGAKFTDTYPAGLVNTTPLVVGGTLAGVTHAAVAGGTSFDVTSAGIPPGGPWTVTVQVKSAVPGSYANVASGVATNQTTGAGNPSAAATLFVNPPLTLTKTSQTISDPANGVVNPKAIPGAQVAYSVQVLNSGGGPVDNNSVMITDAVPANTELVVTDAGAVGSGPIAFIDGAPASGLTYSFVALGNAADDVEFSNNSGATFTYGPVANASGVDPAVTHVRIRPKGAMGGSRTFQVRFRVRIK